MVLSFVIRSIQRRKRSLLLPLVGFTDPDLPCTANQIRMITIPVSTKEKPAENGLFYYRESLDPAKTSMLVSAGFPAIVPVNS